MNVLFGIFLLCNVVGLISDVDGFRFKYNRRLKPETLRYTQYAYSNYISFSPNNGWEQSSNYIKYVPEVRYARTYKFYRGTYTGYISMYYAMASSDTYKNRFIPPDAMVCANYDANNNGDVMGIFTCPNSWEPRNFTYCCGQDYAEFCCDQKPTTSSWVTAVAAVTGIVLAIIIIVVIVVCCAKKRKEKRRDEVLVYGSGRMTASEPSTSSVKSEPQVKMTPTKENPPFAYSTVQ